MQIIERLLVEGENLQRASQEYAGKSSGTLTVGSSGGDATVSLSGEGTTRGLTADPISLSFIDRNIGDGPSGRCGRAAGISRWSPRRDRRRPRCWS